MRFLFLFMDGIGLSDENSETNPFATAHMPNMQALLGDKRMVKGWAPLETERATLLEGRMRAVYGEHLFDCVR